MSEIKILLVDDHAVVRAGLRKALEDVPAITVVGEAENGVNIDEAILACEPNCLLIDVTMPHFDPIPAIKQIRREYPHLKILVVSAYDDDVYVQGLLSAGVNGYHMKDQPLSDLRLAVERVMSGQRWVTGRLLDKLLGGPPTADSGTSTRSQLSPDRLPQLTKRQQGILLLLQKGYDNQRIANEIGISIKTVENHLTRLYRILGVQSRLEAANLAAQNGGLTANTAVRIPPSSLNLTPIASNGGAILIVDDNSRFRHQLRRTLHKIIPQAQISEAESTLSAIHAAQQADPQLVFVDVVLGNENGVDCTKQLRPLLSNGRIILMTAYPDREFRQKGIAAGASALLDKKDLDSTVLRGIIQDTLHA